MEKEKIEEELVNTILAVVEAWHDGKDLEIIKIEQALEEFRFYKRCNLISQERLLASSRPWNCNIPKYELKIGDERRKVIQISETGSSNQICIVNAGSPEGEANAHFIVKAVNYYDHLVEVMKAVNEVFFRHR